MEPAAYCVSRRPGALRPVAGRFSNQWRTTRRPPVDIYMKKNRRRQAPAHIVTTSPLSKLLQSSCHAPIDQQEAQPEADEKSRDFGDPAIARATEDNPENQLEQ